MRLRLISAALTFCRSGVRTEGTFEGRQDLWLRWCDLDGNIIPTGAERADKAEELAGEAEERADEAEQKAQRLAERLRAMGINPDEI